MARSEDVRWTSRSMYRDRLNVPADIQEIFGSQFELPELGPLGTHGLANTRDFESPVASFDVDQSPWESTFRFPECLCTFSDA